jgi:predicted ribonuclease YlaK
VPDNRILASILELRESRPGTPVVLVSKDINLRIKASIFGVPAEDYENDRALDDFSLLYAGHAELSPKFWDRHPEVRSWSERGRTFYEVKLRKDEQWYPNQCVYLPGENEPEFRVLRIADGKAVLQIPDDYEQSHHSVWGIHARNREQNFALNLLMDPDVDFVTLLGTAGTGKTLLALAAGLAQVMDQQRYREIIMTRATVSVGEDIGFLPGTEEEKMTPWMGALTDNLEVLADPQEGGSWGAELHARPHLPVALRDHRRGAEPDPEADEDPADPCRTRYQDGVPGQRRTDRHALPHRNHLRADLCGGPIQGVAALGAHHPAPRRTLAAGGLRVRIAVTLRLATPVRGVRLRVRRKKIGAPMEPRRMP